MAFAVTSDCYLVTSAHVVAGAPRMEMYEGGPPAVVVAQGAVLDVAVLRAEGTFSPVRLVSSVGLKLSADSLHRGVPGCPGAGNSAETHQGVRERSPGAGG